jgi:hypothetical protein
MMQRRELLKMIAAATGTAFVGSFALAYTQVPSVTLADTGFTEDDVAFLNEVGEVILPQTDTPGAKQANVGLMMAVLISDCYSQSQKASFISGLQQIRVSANKLFGKEFEILNSRQRQILIEDIDNQANKYNQAAQKDAPTHPFTLIKQLVLFSFFTSEVGATKVLRHVAIPGSYNGELPYKKGDRAWY